MVLALGMEAGCVAARPYGTPIAARPYGTLIAARPYGTLIAARPDGIPIAARPHGIPIAAHRCRTAWSAGPSTRSNTFPVLGRHLC